MTPLQLEAAANARGKSYLPTWVYRIDDIIEALIIAGAAKDLAEQGVAVVRSELTGQWLDSDLYTGRIGPIDADTYEQAVTLAAARRLDAEKERSGG